MMDGTNGGLGAGAGLTWVLVGVFWVVVIGVIVYAVIKLLPSTKRAKQPVVSSHPSEDETPEEALDRLLILGEIDEETYRVRRAALLDPPDSQS